MDILIAGDKITQVCYYCDVEACGERERHVYTSVRMVEANEGE